MYQSIFGPRYIGGYKVDIFGWDDVTEQIEYYVHGGNGKTRRAKRHYAPWVCRLHGNPPPGTLLEYYQIILPNGKKVNYNIYI